MEPRTPSSGVGVSPMLGVDMRLVFVFITRTLNTPSLFARAGRTRASAPYTGSVAKADWHESWVTK